MPRKKTDTQEKEENKASIEENFAQLEESAFAPCSCRRCAGFLQAPFWKL